MYKNQVNIIHFRTARKALINVVFKYINDNLEFVSRYEYLGINLDEDLKFDTYIIRRVRSVGFGVCHIKT